MENCNNVAEGYAGRHIEIIQRRKEVKSRTLQARKDYNRAAGKRGNDL
jgi:hypothetical protein